MTLETLEARLSEAIAQFWQIRDKQLEKVGGDDTQQYAGTRGAVVAGGHLNGFLKLIRALLVEGGLEDACIYPNSKTAILPGFFRATKQWDLVVVSEGKLIATVELKSQVGSFGNNTNNRMEEAVGNAVDIHTAFRDGAFAPSAAPWIGYLMLIEDCKASKSKIRISEPHYKVFPEFRDSSYAKRYELFCQKIVRERLYNAACFITSTKAEGKRGIYHEPCEEVGFKAFAASLIGHAAGIAKVQGKS